MKWEKAIFEPPPVDTGGLRGRIALARFRHRRRTLEAQVFSWGPIMLWYMIKEENDRMGVWRG
jgi:hypothetical protein